jgi:phosphohistidine phosphatase
MEIYLLRHGIAEEGTGLRDADRALTSEGKKKLRETLKAAEAAEVAPALIISSPYRRAWETAQIAAEVLQYKHEILKSKTLTPSSEPRLVWEEIREHKDLRDLMLVGHEPLFSSLTGYLLGVPELVVDFKKGTIIRIDCERFGPEPRGALRWMLVPKLAGK